MSRNTSILLGVDYVFILVGDGRLADPGIGDGRRERVTLGGVKYSEFEVERGQPILDLVYEPAVGSSTIGAPSPGGAPE